MKNTKKPVGCVPLETLNVPVIPAAPEADKAKAKFVHLKVDGKCVTEFAEHSKAAKDAETKKNDAKLKFARSAMLEWFKHNLTNPTEPLTTVKVTDEGGGCCNVSFKDQYCDLPYSEALKVLTQLGVRNPNKFVEEHVLIGFDPGIFAGPCGVRTELFTDMVEAIQAVADKHSVHNPLSSTKVLRVKTDFHKERWTIGNNEIDQETLTQTYKNTVSFTPVVA